MNTTLAKVLQPVIVYGLGIICPAVPGVVWSALVGALLSGDITPAHILQFCKDHNIKTYDEYPTGKNGQSS